MADLSIQQRYRLIYDELIDMTAVRSLTKVYLPIIGRDAYTLYLAWATLGETPEAKNRHVDLLDQLAMNQQAFLTARSKLEGMGLVKSYKQTTNFGSQWTYRIFPPMAVRAFLSDALLSSLLAHYLGDELFDELVKDELPDSKKIAGENVSKTFFDLAGQESFVHRNHAPFSTSDHEQGLAQEVRKATKSLNLGLMADMLKSYGIKLRTLQTNEADLMIQKALYGLSDIELVRVIQATTSPNKQIDLPAIKKSLEGNFRKIQVRTKDIETKVQTNEPKQSSNDESNPAIRLVQTAKSVAPLQFLKNLRQKNNGFVADNEVKAISDIAEMNIVEPEVLNIVLYELTVIENRTTLNKTILQTLVNDWAQSDVTDAVSALQYLQRRSKKQQSRQTSQSSKKWSRQNKQSKQETRPDWENQHGTPISKADADSAREALAAMRARRKQNNSEEN